MFSLSRQLENDAVSPRIRNTETRVSFHPPQKKSMAIPKRCSPRQSATPFFPGSSSVSSRRAQLSPWSSRIVFCFCKSSWQVAMVAVENPRKDTTRFRSYLSIQYIIYILELFKVALSCLLIIVLPVMKVNVHSEHCKRSCDLQRSYSMLVCRSLVQ